MWNMKFLSVSSSHELVYRAHVINHTPGDFFATFFVTSKLALWLWPGTLTSSLRVIKYRAVSGVHPPTSWTPFCCKFNDDKQKVPLIKCKDLSHLWLDNAGDDSEVLQKYNGGNDLGIQDKNRHLIRSLSWWLHWAARQVCRGPMGPAAWVRHMFQSILCQSKRNFLLW